MTGRQPTSGAPNRTTPDAPSVILAVLDAIGPSSDPAPTAQTPNLDRLAARGLRYMGFHATGLMQLAASCELFRELLRSYGYCSFAVGGWPCGLDALRHANSCWRSSHAMAGQCPLDQAAQIVDEVATLAPRRPVFLQVYEPAPAERADPAIARLVQSLERAGRLEDTLFLVLPSCAAANEPDGTPREGPREPMLVHWPSGIVAAGEFRRQHVHAIDVLPTALDVLGIENDLFDGMSFADTFSHPDQRRAGFHGPIPLGAWKYACFPGTTPLSLRPGGFPRNRSHLVVAETIVPQGGAEGVLLAQGSRFGASSLFVKDGRLCYARTCVDAGRLAIRSEGEVPAGPCTFAFELRKRPTPVFRHSVCAYAVGRLYLNGSLSAEARFPVAPSVTEAIEGDVLCCGHDCGLLATLEYQAPFRFTGVIERVVVDVSGEPYEPDGLVEPTPEARR